MSVFLFCALFKAIVTEKLPVWKLVLLCVGFFCLGGGNWVSCTSAVVIYGGFAAAVIFLRKPKKTLIPYLFLLVGYLITALASGNSNRVEMVGEELGLIRGLAHSFSSASDFIFSDIRIWLFALFMVPVLWKLCRHSQQSFRFAAWIPLYSLCVLASAFFPLHYTNYYVQPRHTDAIFLLFVCMLPWNLFCVIGWLMKWVSIRIDKSRNYSKTLFAWAAAVIVLFGLLSFDAPQLSHCTLQPVKALIHWVDGHSSYYADYYDSVVEDIRALPDGDVEIHWMVTDQMMNPYPLITDDSTHWINEAIALYYGGENCTVRYTEP